MIIAHMAHLPCMLQSDLELASSSPNTTVKTIVGNVLCSINLRPIGVNLQPWSLLHTSP